MLSSLFHRGSGDRPLLSKRQSSAAVGLHLGVVFDDACCPSKPSLMRGAGLPGIVWLRAIPWVTQLQTTHLPVVLFGHASGSPGLGPTFAMLGLGCSALAVRWSFARSNFLFFAQQTLALVQAWRLALCPTGAVRAAAEVGEAGGGAGWARSFTGELGAFGLGHLCGARLVLL